MSDKAKKILVVDDNDENRDILQRRLERAGYSIVSVSEGRAALSALQSDQYDLVILDIHMPIMDGVETLKRIKADKTTSAIPVIMLTALEDRNIVLECMRGGACSYITKPYNMKEVEQRIISCLEE